MDVVILGNGGHGRDVEAIALECAMFTRYLDDEKGEPCNSPIAPNEAYIIGVWDPEVRSTLDRPGEDSVTLVHPSARIGPGCHLSEGVVIGPGAVLAADVYLGRHVHVGAHATLTRCTIGDYTTISNGATVCGDVRIGDLVLIGANATIKNLVRIGRGGRVGCGANVIDDVPAYTTVVSPKAVAA